MKRLRKSLKRTAKEKLSKKINTKKIEQFLWKKRYQTKEKNIKIVLELINKRKKDRIKINPDSSEDQTFDS